MNNSRGSTLAIAVSMVFLFAALGAGAINFGGAQDLFWTNQEASAKAFWLADGAMQQALIQLETTPPAGNYSSGIIPMYNNSNYSYTTTGANPYTVIATGNAGSFPRTLQATIENFQGITHNTAATYSGTIDHSGAVSNGDLLNGAVHNTNLDPQLIFGTSLSNVEALATKTYVNGASIPNPLVVSGITVIKTTSALTLNNVSSSSPALLIIDTTGASSPEASNFINFAQSSSVFNGIIYVLGNVFIDKNIIVNGAVYVQGNLSFHDSGGGNGGVIFGNSTDVAGAGNPFIGHLFINSWEECKNITATTYSCP